MREHPSPSMTLLLPLLLHLTYASSDLDYGGHPRFVCTPIPAGADPACAPPAPGHQSAPPAGWWGASEEAKATILHLRESLVQQKETILDQRETIRELTAKLTLCEGLAHHGHAETHGDRHGNLIPDSPQREKGNHVTSSPEQMERMLLALKDRLENLQKRNTSITYSSSLKDLLQRKIDALEQQLHRLGGPERHHDDDSHRDEGEGDRHDRDGHKDDDHGDHGDHGDHTGHRYDDDHGDDDDDHHRRRHHEGDGDSHDDSRYDDGHHDDMLHSNEADSHAYPLYTEGHGAGAPRGGFHGNKLETVLSQLHLAGSGRKKPVSPASFQIGFPMRTNYMYGRVKRTPLREMFALTLCLWLKAGAGPGVGTPISYSAPGQANELVLIEWGNNPMELLIDDQAATLPLSLSDGKWHHVCITWSTRDGHWEAYQDGQLRGSGVNLSAWHAIKPGGVFILGQEQDTLGGRFDATQSFVGEMSELQVWSRVLGAADVYALASCGSRLQGDVVSWSDGELELHGGVSRYPFDQCH